MSVDAMDPLAPLSALDAVTAGTERLVILSLDGEVVDSSLLHLPGTPIPAHSAPYSWWSVCGLEGIVYAQGGPLTFVPVCGECVA